MVKFSVSAKENTSKNFDNVQKLIPIMGPMHIFIYLELSFVALSSGSTMEILTGLSHSARLFSYNIGGSAVCSFIECCDFLECCDSQWIYLNSTYLQYEIDSKLYGQPFVKEKIVKPLRDHVNSISPEKALVLSFHGWTGTGKIFASNIVTESLYRKGTRSQYVHYFVGPQNLQQMQDAATYVSHLQDWIRGNVSQCANSLFIFDEVDKMPQEVMDGIKSFIDHQKDDGISYRKSIFIFLSNTGGNLITERMHELWKEEKKRHELTMEDFSDLFEKGVFAEKGGLHESDVTGGQLVDSYVPFLPLERGHVRLCARDAFQFRNFTASNDMLKAVVDAMTYHPTDSKVYSTTGCKYVLLKVDAMIEEFRKHEEL